MNHHPAAAGSHRATRRGLLGAATAVGAAAATAHLPHAAAADDASVEVVVVGAGFAGLMAARTLAQAGVDVLLLEARNRVGGRVVNLPMPGGGYIDGGGQYIGPTQDRMYALADEFGVETFPTFEAGRTVSAYHDAAGNEVSVTAEDQAAYADLVEALQALADEVAVDAPWAAANAREWDSQTFQSWLDANAINATAVAMLTTAGHTLWGAEPRNMSLLFVLFYIAAAGNAEHPGRLQRLLDIADGAQAERLVGGTAGLANQIATTLGERLRLNTPVTGIAWTEHGAQVMTTTGVVEAQRVIVAAPPSMVAALTFEPALPALRAQLLQRWPMGSIAKCQAVYPTPFWREEGLSGESLTDQSPVDLTFDNTPVAGEPGILLGFMGGERARAWSDRPAAERQAAVLENFRGVVGEPALDPIAYLEMNWSAEVWTRGGPGGFMTPGTLLDFGTAIREPVGPIHWAGTETATYWTGYIEGAVRSGERAAEEVLQTLGSAAGTETAP